MNEIGELKEKITFLQKELDRIAIIVNEQDNKIDDLNDLIYLKQDKISQLEDDLSHNSKIIEELTEEKEEILKLLKEFWLSQEKQTPFDKQIHELLEGKIDNYQTPYFLKPL